MYLDLVNLLHSLVCDRFLVKKRQGERPSDRRWSLLLLLRFTDEDRKEV